MNELSDAPIILACEVHKRYVSRGMDVAVLHGVNLAVARGEMVAIIGPSGSGKSTLLNCLAGLEPIDSGQIAIDGIDLSELTERQRTTFRAQKMGFVFQNFNLLPVLNAVENVELPLLLTRMDATEARERARTLLDVVGLAAREHHMPAELSGGQRQRVALARALITEPAILWADEPTGNLDSEAEAATLQLLHALNRDRGQTLVLVTHSATVAASMHRTIQLRDGRIVVPSDVPT